MIVNNTSILAYYSYKRLLYKAVGLIKFNIGKAVQLNSGKFDLNFIMSRIMQNRKSGSCSQWLWGKFCFLIKWCHEGEWRYGTGAQQQTKWFLEVDFFNLTANQMAPSGLPNIS